MSKPVRIAQTIGVRRRLLHEEVAEHLRTMIAEETLAEGSRIDELALCELLAISRTPLREALKVLQSEGLVAIEPHRGARVVEISDAELDELFEVLGGLERLAAELAAMRATDGDLQALEALHDEMESCHRALDPQGYFVLNQQIHQRIIELSGNRQLQREHIRLSGKTRRGRYQSTLSRQHLDASLDEHRALLVSLKCRDGHRAGQVMHEHVLKTGATIRACRNRPERFDVPANG